MLKFRNSYRRPGLKLPHSENLEQSYRERFLFDVPWHRVLADKTFLSGFFFYLIASLDQIGAETGERHYKLNVIALGLCGLITFLYSRKRPPRLFICSSFCLIFIGLISSIVNGLDTENVVYLCYMLICIIFITSAAMHFASPNPKLFFLGVIFSLSTQVLVAAILFAAGIHDRARLLYYEPSYFSMAAAPLFAITAYHATNLHFRKMAPFLSLCLIFLYTSKSANALLIVATTAALALIYSRSGENTTPAKYAGLAALCLVVLGISAAAANIISEYRGTDLLLTTLQTVYQSETPVTDILARGGNRTNRLVLAWDVFLVNFETGVSPGDYIRYISSLNHELFSEPAWLSPQDQPAINIFLEVAATTGLLGLTAFCFMIYSVLTASSAAAKSSFGPVLHISLIAILVSLMFENSYLRVYFWILVGIAFATRRQST